MKLRLSFVRSLWLVLVMAMLAAHTLAAAQTVVAAQAVSAATVRVDIWPEYDQPNVLVIYNIALDPSVSLPANLSVRIPAAARQPHAVAYQDNTGLYTLNYSPVVDGDWIEIRFTTPMPDVVVEYYDPALTKDGAQRNYTFRWPADFTVETLSVRVQQPINASGMTFRPSAGAGRQGTDGLVYYDLLAGRVPAGTTFDLAMAYTKPDDSLTSPNFQPVQPNQPLDTSATGQVRLDQALPWAVGGLGLLLIVAGVVWFWRTGRVQTDPDLRGHGKRRTRHASSGPARAQEAPSGEGVFCHQCGKKAGAGDLFCRSCGTRLR